MNYDDYSYHCISCSWYQPSFHWELKDKAATPWLIAGYCHRYPTELDHPGNHWCGEFLPKLEEET